MSLKWIQLKFNDNIFKLNDNLGFYHYIFFYLQQIKARLRIFQRTKLVFV